MASHLLLVHVGPVQDFIASARRCRDLWYGSHLLSAASRVVAMELSADANTTLVFPGHADIDAAGSASVSNKIQCRVDDRDAAGVRRMAEAARTALETWMDELSDAVFDRVQKELGDDHQGLFRRARAEAQIADLFEFYWVAVPLEDEASYPAARTLGDRLLAARKNTRDWDAAQEEVFGVPKSSLDGVREAVIHEEAYGKGARLSAARRRRIFGVRSEERLCGIGLVKRLGRPGDEDQGDDPAPIFHSSSHMASAGVRTAIAGNPDARGAWEAFTRELSEHMPGLPDLRIRARATDTQALSWTHAQPGAADSDAIEVPFVLPLPGGNPARGLDGVLLYRDRLKALWDDFREEHGAADQLPGRLEDLQRQVLRAVGVQEPLPYYAMMMADGDRMGAALDTLAEHAGSAAQEQHQALSAALDTDFAGRCDGIVRSHGGSLLYAGGDDALALVPLGTALACARALRERFCDAMKGHFPQQMSTPTLSVGIAIVHHLEPLSRVRMYAKQAERAAKDAGRDRLAVLLKKRGGGPRMVVGPWTSKEKDKPLDARLLEWAHLLREGRLATRLAGRLDETMTPLRPTTPEGAALSTEELERVVRSLVRLNALRRNERGGGKADGSLAQQVEALFDSVHGDREAALPPDPLRTVERMVDELRIAELIRDAWNESFGKPAPDTREAGAAMEEIA